MAQEAYAMSAVTSLVLPVPTPQTFGALFSGDIYVNSTATLVGNPSVTGRAAWMSLFSPDAQLQDNCNAQGFNVQPEVNGTASRIGIVSNNEDDCSSPDSIPGVSGLSTGCATVGSVGGESVGNLCGCTCTTIQGLQNQGGVDLAGFAWVFVR